jgi:hypothetical protein
MKSFKELFERENVSVATFDHNNRYDVVYSLAGDESDIEIYDKQDEKVVVDEIDIPENEVLKLLKKYKFKGK